MDALVWWLIPLVSGVVAVIWTSVLARRERRRNSPQWRAQRLAEVGHVLRVAKEPPPTKPVAQPAGTDSQGSGGAT